MFEENIDFIRLMEIATDYRKIFKKKTFMKLEID